MSCVEKGLWLAVALGLAGCSEQDSKKGSQAVAQGPEVDQATQVRQAVEAGQKKEVPASEGLERPGAFDVEAVPEKPIEAKAEAVLPEKPAKVRLESAETKEESQKEDTQAEPSLEESNAEVQEGSSEKKAEAQEEGSSEVVQEGLVEDSKAEPKEAADEKLDTKEGLMESSKAEGREVASEKTEEAAENISAKEEKTGEAVDSETEAVLPEENFSEVKGALSTEAEEAKTEPAEENEGSSLESAAPVKASAELPDLSKLFVLAKAELPAKSAKASVPIKGTAKAEKKDAAAQVEDTDAVVKARIEELKTLQSGAPCVAWLDAHAATYIVRDGVLKKAPKGKLSEEDRQHFSHTFTEFIAANIKTFLPLIKDYSVEKVSLLRETKKLRNFALVMRENNTKEAINVEVLVTIKGLRIVDVVAKETSLRSILATSFQDLMQSKNPREAWDHLIQNGKSA